MRAVPMTEFEGRVSDYVTAAEGGEEILVTRDGLPAVRLLPAKSQHEIFQRQRRALNQSLETREKLRAQGVSITAAEIREWIDEGRP